MEGTLLGHIIIPSNNLKDYVRMFSSMFSSLFSSMRIMEHTKNPTPRKKCYHYPTHFCEKNSYWITVVIMVATIIMPTSNCD